MRSFECVPLVLWLWLQGCNPPADYVLGACDEVRSEQVQEFEYGVEQLEVGTQSVRAVCGSLYISGTGEQIARSFRRLEYVTGDVDVHIESGELPNDYLPSLRLIGGALTIWGDALNTSLVLPARVSRVHHLRVSALASLRELSVDVESDIVDFNGLAALETLSIRIPTQALVLTQIPRLSQFTMRCERARTVLDTLLLHDIPLDAVRDALGCVTTITGGLDIVNEEVPSDVDEPFLVNLHDLSGFVRVEPCGILADGLIAPNLSSLRAELQSAYCVTPKTFPRLRSVTLECGRTFRNYGGPEMERGRAELLARDPRSNSVGCD